MAISQIPLASTGLTSADIAPLARTSDLSGLVTTSGLITQPTYTLIGSYNINTTAVSALTISLSSPSLYRSFRIMINGFNVSSNDYPLMRLNNVSTSNIYRSSYRGFDTMTTYGTNNVTQHIEYSGFFLYSGAAAIQGTALIHGYLDLYNVNTSERKLLFGQIGYLGTSAGGNTPTHANISGDANISESITSIHISVGHNIYTPSSTAGIFVYGVK
jgi:hypothetical protein